MLCDISECAHAPSLRNLAEVGVDEAVGEEVVEVGGQAGQGLAALPAALQLGADGFEIDEPRLEQRARHRFQRGVAAAVEFDLVVQRAEDVGDGALFFRWRQFDFKPPKC